VIVGGAIQVESKFEEVQVALACKVVMAFVAMRFEKGFHFLTVHRVTPGRDCETRQKTKAETDER
jgi:hypothetical protein